MEQTVRWGRAVSIVALVTFAGCGPEAETDSDANLGEAGQALRQQENNKGGVKPAPAKQDVVRVQSAPELDRMKTFVEARVERSAVRKTLKTARGRKVECVDIAAQPALRNPLLGAQKLLRAPRSAPLAAESVSAAPEAFVEPLFEADASASTDAVAAATAQVGRCPEDTVPIPEVTLDDLSRFSSMEDFFAKYPSHLRQNEAGIPGAPEGLLPPVHYGPTSQHQYAHAYRYVRNWGAQTNINIWKPYTELNGEFSLGQIWVVGGSGTGLQTLEVGSQKYHNLYGDNESHLFIYSTRDGYRSTGCYNNTCGDFVQVSSSIYPGAVLTPASVSGGTQYDANINWFKDMDGGAWWLSFQGQWIGYYPRSLYSSSGVQNRAAEIDFGGEIIDNRNLNLHTSTDMGSGAFPSAGWQHAAYMRSLRYNYATTTNPNTVWTTEATGLTTSRSDAACYDISYHTGDPNWGAYFYYGGPGYDSNNCR